MMPWDWIGMVTIRSDTRRSTSISGTINRRPGSRTPTTRPRRNSTPFSYCWTIRTDSANPSNTSTSATTTISQPLIPSSLLAGTAPAAGPARPSPWVCTGAAADGTEAAETGSPVRCSPPLESQGRSRPATPPLNSTGRRVLTTAGRRDLRPAGADLDALGGGLLHLGHQDLEHAVVGRGLDPLCHHMGGQGDRPPEGAVAALDPVELLLGGVMGEVALTLDGQQAILQGDPQVIGLDPGQLDRDQVGVLALGDVQRRRPGRGRTAALLLAVQAERTGKHRAHLGHLGHLLLRVAQVLEWVPSRHGRHLASLLHGPCGPAARGGRRSGVVISVHLSSNTVYDILNTVHMSRSLFRSLNMKERSAWRTEPRHRPTSAHGQYPGRPRPMGGRARCGSTHPSTTPTAAPSSPASGSSPRRWRSSPRTAPRP